ncbi:MAG: enoyl-CoA hydratase/isomerase family protein [Myxococcales bacterium]|nr:enoyl-CoA hydratase/isomerase family protein [Myxococcales bacterium]
MSALPADLPEPTLLVSTEGGIATLTVNRPAALNALNASVLFELDTALTILAADAALRCVIVTGAGPKSFVAGADIAEMVSMGPHAARKFSAFGHRVLAAIEALPVPVIAAVNGFALGGGCELALACDLIYASDNARFGQPEVNLGLIPGFGGTQRLARKIGRMRALELCVSGRSLKADEARAVGLCLEVFPQGELISRVTQIALGIASKGPIAVRTAKAVLTRGLDAPLAVGNAYEVEAFANLFDTRDAREGMTAFIEKRAAHFDNT